MNNRMGLRTNILIQRFKAARSWRAGRGSPVTDLSRGFRDQALVSGFGIIKCVGQLWRIQKAFGQSALVLCRQGNDLCFGIRLLGTLMGGRNHEITDAPALNFGPMLDPGQSIGRNPRFGPW